MNVLTLDKPDTIYKPANRPTIYSQDNPFGITYLGRDCYRVPSDEDIDLFQPKTHYVVDLSSPYGDECECPQWQKKLQFSGGKCKHMKRVYEYRDTHPYDCAEHDVAGKSSQQEVPFISYPEVGNPAPQQAFIPTFAEVEVDSPLVALFEGQ